MEKEIRKTETKKRNTGKSRHNWTEPYKPDQRKRNNLNMWTGLLTTPLGEVLHQSEVMYQGEREIRGLESEMSAGLSSHVPLTLWAPWIPNMILVFENVL